MDESKPQDQPQDQQPNPFAPGQEPPVSMDQTQQPAPVQVSDQSATTAEQPSSDATANTAGNAAPAADSAPVVPDQSAPAVDSKSSASDEHDHSTVNSEVLDASVNPASVPNVVTAPIETVAAEDQEQTAATAPQPPQATVMATGDVDQPVKIVQVEQPMTLPDPDPNAEDGTEVPNPNVITSQNAEIPSTLNPDATNTPAPITPAERVAHIEIQQNTAPGESVTATQLSGDYAAAPSAQAEAAGVPATHKSILERLIKDMEGIAAMGKSEIIAVLGIVKARFDEIEGKDE